ncbi:arginine--tRNA ligase [archaeon SCG-AAA382B04]|nr:arginine--tRNA ligase [archaeon SCG-AAA382B04]
MFLKAYGEIKTRLREVLAQKNWEVDDLKLEEPREIADLATAVAFKISSKTDKKPIEIAKEIENQLNQKTLEYVEKTEATEPGYINFFFSQKQLKNHLNQLIHQKKEIGTIKEDKGNVIVEHTSANPTGPLHIGHLRNAVIGDTLENILEKSGYNTQTQYYLNDMGKQMAILLHGIREYGLGTNKSQDEAIGEIYSKTNSEDHEIDQEEVQDIMQKLENKDKETKRELDQIVDKCYKGIQKSLKQLNIQIDEVIKESKFVFDDSVEEIFQQLKPFIEIDDGAAQIEFDEIDKELVLKREDGTSVYALRDLAYHKWKAQKATNNIDILGSDHKLYSKQLKKTLELIGIKPPETIIFEFVSLPAGEMSTRKGEFISIRELFEEVRKKAYEEVDERRKKPREWKQEVAKEVAIAAIRYDFIKVAPNKPISFDLEKAVSFKKQGAPFIQYSHARASNILQKSGKDKTKIQAINDPVINDLVKHISRFSYVIQKSAEKRKPHLFAEYLFELASKFNQFYRDKTVLDSEQPKRQNRLAVVELTKKALKEGIQTLGFEAPKEM